MARICKHDQICRDLTARIAEGVLPVGAPLPTQTQLMQEYGVALGTVRQALSRLQTAGLVRAHRGKGTFVRELPDKAAPPETHRVGLIVVRGEGSLGTVLEQGAFAAQQVLADHGLDLLLHVFRGDQVADAVRWAERLDGILVCGTVAEGLAEQLAEQLAERRKPVVFIGDWGSNPPTASRITGDGQGGVTMAMQFLHSLGHRRIMLVTRGGTLHYERVQRHFETSAAEVGIGQQCSKLILREPADEAGFVHALEQVDPAPTGLIIEGGQLACRLVHQMAGEGWHVPERVSVVAINAARADQLSIPNLSRVGVVFDVIYQAAAKAVVDLMQSGRPTDRCFAPRLVWGQTCRPLHLD